MDIRIQKGAADLLAGMGLVPAEVAVTFHELWQERVAVEPSCDGVGGAIEGHRFFGGIRTADGQTDFILMHLP